MGDLATIERFEDLEAWMKARELAREIYKITGKNGFSKDYDLQKQIRRAAISIMSNIAEGFERQGDKEFQHFLSIAKGSAGEVRAQLYVAFDACLINEDQFKKLFMLVERVSRMIYGLIIYLHKSKSKVESYRSKVED
jgi:four helix bundle protein